MPTFNPPIKSKKSQSPLLLTVNDDKSKSNYSSRDKIYTSPINSNTSIDPEQKIKQLSQSLTKLRIRVNLITVMVILSFVFNILVLIVQMQKDQTIANSQPARTAINNRVEASLILTNEQSNSTSIIGTFQNNPAFFDFGFKVDVRSNSIANLDDSNCKTPIVPPTINGCGFGLNLQKLGLASNLVAYKNIVIEPEFSGSEDQIQIDLKNYEKGTLDQTIGIISSNPATNNIILPASIPDSQGLYFRFWSKSGSIRINRMTLNYYSSSDLSPLKLNINLENTKKEFTSVTIFRDVDEDGRYNPEKDKKWACTATFPGVDQIQLESNSGRNVNRTVDLIRDESCIIGTKPDSWAGDNGLNSIPSGKWLLVLDKDNYAAFSIDPENKAREISLTI